MAPPTLQPPSHATLKPTPLTRPSFSPFGTAIIPPLPRTLTTPPIPLSSHPRDTHVPEPVAANQLSALKYSPISPLTDTYGTSKSGVPSEGRLSMFSCFPRTLRKPAGGNEGEKKERSVFDIRILERHPYTTQTFSPLGLSASESNPETYFLVIVAPTLKGQTAIATTESGEKVTIQDPPDLGNVKAFVARGDQAVTYGAGTWHAPMVVLGKSRVDFLVVQFVNGVGEEDCQEVSVGEGVVVQVEGQGGCENFGLWEKKRAKL
ncbi:ureidoglycolate hydrolase [Aspergillus karnatakaensis]|uniref:ureidoglycolate hydrolase n=1 Tax=Aspergillus karnatakaensis TaxID=1810916 RepID=UPI003CCDE74B